MNIVTPAEGKKDRVQELLSHLVSEVETNEPEALAFYASWVADVGVFYVIELFANEAAQESHRQQSYTAELRRICREEHNLAKKVEVQVLSKFAGFSR
ncbi:hypothetical protein PG999_002048 [Apiospora kogelbergensis]|uniref:ABM domain-containing protein n=1 Tax=Apiospora kogelbergensis TaxID=1337665 RepID=A0AAW0R782_9PEZI